MDERAKTQNHTGHRQRLRASFLNDKDDNFDDQKILELLLQYSIPRVDTAPIAAELLNRYADLNRIFGCDLSELAKVKGIGENTAVFIKLIKKLTERLTETQNDNPGNIYLKNLTDAAAYINNLEFDEERENFYILSLSSDYKLIDFKLLSKGSVITTKFSLRDIVEFAVKSRSHYIILFHNHTDKNIRPSREDIELTKKCADYLKEIEIYLIDHIITDGEKCFSFANNKLLKTTNLAI